ncbi:MAG: hypothetical protein AAB610_01525 [Patescibacteria group bacterium]
MEPNTQNSSGMMNGIPPVPKPERKVGPIIGTLVIVLIIIIAALWFFGGKLDTTSQESNVNQEVPIRNEAGLSTSTNEVDLEADLDAQLQDVDYSF